VSDVEARFWSKVAKGEGCWEWKPRPGHPGYGQFSITGRNRIYAHRYVWQSLRGAIPEKMMVCHTCDNPRCVNPDHLFLGTNSDNQRDSSAKGRHRNSRKTHCKNGHPLSGENLQRNKSGRRCRICVSIENARSYYR
jgi:hypothetical protein